MPTFVGPTTSGAAWRGSTPPAAALFRHYGTVTEGVNVYILTDGTVTTQDQTDLTRVAHVLFGGHTEPITDAEAALLVTAGFGSYITDQYSDIYSDVYA